MSIASKSTSKALGGQNQLKIRLLKTTVCEKSSLVLGYQRFYSLFSYQKPLSELIIDGLNNQRVLRNAGKVPFQPKLRYWYFWRGFTQNPFWRRFTQNRLLEAFHSKPQQEPKKPKAVQGLLNVRATNGASLLYSLISSSISLRSCLVSLSSWTYPHFIS